MRLLLIEENKHEANCIKGLLKQEKYLIDMAFTPKAGVDLAQENIYDLILLSYDFTAGLSMRILTNIRSRGINTPILILGKDLSINKMESCLRHGADDFLGKPFSSELLLLRLKIISKRRGGVGAYYRLGDVEFIPDRHVIRGIDGEMSLTGKESDLLELLVVNRRQVLSKTLIESKLWPNSDDFSQNLIEVHISNLRKKLRQMTELLKIETIRNGGYCFRVEEDSLYSVY